MTDVVNAETRSRMMSGIRAENTKPEKLIRSQLHKRGFRFRLHHNKLPGKPDIVLKRYQAVILVHGCFWHRHECHLFRWPKTRPIFWKNKITGNHENDQKIIKELATLGWRVCVVWECSLKGPKADVPNVTDSIAAWLMTEENTLEISG